MTIPWASREITMPCLGLKIVLASQTAGIVLTGVKAVSEAPTVVLAPAALAALAVQFAGFFATAHLLAMCLDAADRGMDAETLRRDIDKLERELRQLPH
jgi:hypothetical protein